MKKHTYKKILAGLLCLAALGAENTLSVKAEESREFGFTGQVETYTAPYSGEYTLEVWGAQGGGAEGGKGGYSQGTIYLTAGQTVYVCVGGQGTSVEGHSLESNPSRNNTSGGYNGGGNSPLEQYEYEPSWQEDTITYLRSRATGGGGCTSITTENRGELYNFAEHISEVLIVAGGGGGGIGETSLYGITNDPCYGGAGGGEVGGQGSITYGDGFTVSKPSDVNYKGENGDSYVYYAQGGNQFAGGQRGFWFREKFVWDDYESGYQPDECPTADEKGDGSFGKGGDGAVGDYGGFPCGGGAGWFGGGGGAAAYGSAGGGGGAGYTGGVEDGYMESGVREGNGYAKITLNHSHTYTSEVTTEATCTTSGVKTFTCTGTETDPGCGDSYTEEIQALGHADNDTWHTTTEATCTAKGIQKKYCTRCGIELHSQEIPALGHAYPSDYSYEDNNGITNGLAYKNCTRCGVRLDTKWLNRIRVRYQNADGTLESYANVLSDYFYSGVLISWNRAADVAYKYAGTSWTSTSAAKSEDITVYRNSYTLTLNKGTGISAVGGAGTYLYDSSVTIAATVKPGYTFKNWTGNFTTTTNNYTFNMPGKAVTLTANATPNPDTPYKVNHYQMNITDNNYTLKETENKTGTTDTQVTPPVKTYTGFTSPVTQTVNIDGDGSTVVNYYYTRNSYTLTLSKGTGIQTVSGAGTYKYDSSVTIAATVKPGYTFKNWTGTLTYINKTQTFNMHGYNVSLTANATPNTDTPYTVRHWVQKVTKTSTEHNDTNYELADTDYLKGTTDTMVTPPVKPLTGKYEGCIAPPLQSKNIEGDGSMVIDYYYDRTKVTLDIDGEYLGQVSGTTDDICSFDVYINGTKVADDVTDYKNEQILYGSTYEVKDIKPVGGKHYYGVDVK